ncbi:hypothetical protein B0H17DRAFT_151686, partial [Mycena rosella]
PNQALSAIGIVNRGPSFKNECGFGVCSIAPLPASPVLHFSLHLLYLKNGLRRPRPVLVQLGTRPALPRPPPAPRLGQLEHKVPRRLARGALCPAAGPYTAEAAPRTAPARPRIRPPRAPLRSVRGRPRRLHLAEHPAHPRAPAHTTRRGFPLPFTHCIHVRSPSRTRNQGPPPRPLLYRRLPPLRLHIHHPVIHTHPAPAFRRPRATRHRRAHALPRAALPHPRRARAPPRTHPPPPHLRRRPPAQPVRVLIVAVRRWGRVV